MFLYTQRNKDEGVEVKLDELTIDTNYFDPSKICFFVSHGYTENYLGSNNVPIRDAILSKHDVNVFLLDWSKFSSLFYTTSVVAVPKIGAVFGNAIENLMEKYGMSYEQIHLCGHSLGAHVVGAIGATMGGNADRIIATDPALPLFWLNDTEKRLDISDAKFVQVIHTNGGLQGFRSSIGHADYFPNGGGMNQPGCGSDLLGNCAHARAHKYYSESILTSRFVAKRCPSYEDFQLNRGCDSESLLGEFFTDKKQYYSDEERTGVDVDGQRFIVMQDESGVVHLVDLHARAAGAVANISDVTVFFYTQTNPTNPIEIKVEQFDGFIKSDLFDSRKDIVFTTHGWGGSHTSKTNIFTKDGILAHYDVNVFVIDWFRPANEFYTVAKLSVPIVGKIMGNFINNLMEKNGIQARQIVIVGQSLGGQLIGSIGSNMKVKPSALVALDPAQPLFFVDDDPDTRLDASDAEFVEVIHTNAGFLGFKSSIGHADYYPNGGGMRQPGCGPDILGTCAHYRAYYYYGEALLTSGFKAHRCDSYEKYQAGNCSENSVSYMGVYPVHNQARGDYYLNTAASEPFALG
ncbi:PREDICTED: pancreatic triacylglycerol lipase-like [Nicrophorus vespilloides]|uniref:Pancreatic triacylglycerol lipase-like n=1 Tax=Nicrophorus vespilloides TaxID=110193 RepID=A0ABM1NKD7_NICVS|nr:PREDICTED: pancreatic triacylglycerol lipase-like [Nicrophorus vespilloides]